MIIKKIDNRFRLAKTGQAVLVAYLNHREFMTIDKEMRRAFGPGQVIYPESQAGDDSASWYYSYKPAKDPKDPYAPNAGMSFTLYLRTESQASFMALILS